LVFELTMLPPIRFHFDDSDMLMIAKAFTDILSRPKSARGPGHYH